MRIPVRGCYSCSKMTIEEIQKEIVEDFSMFDDWMDRYAMLIEMGKECPIIDEQYRD